MQHRCVRVRQPRPAQHGHPDRQLHPVVRAPPNGPNFYEFGDDVRYDINDRQQRRRPGRHQLPVPLPDPSARPRLVPVQHRPDRGTEQPQLEISRQFYTVTRLEDGKVSVLGSGLACPPCNIGPLSTPNYASLAEHSRAQARRRRDPGVRREQRAEGFYVDSGSIFDLANLRPFEQLHAQYGLNVFSGPAAGRQREQRRAERAHHRHPGADLAAHPGPGAGSESSQASVIGVWTTASCQSVRAVGRRTTARTSAWPLPPGPATRQPAGQRGPDPAGQEGPVEHAGPDGRQAVRGSLRGNQPGAGHAAASALYPGVFPNLAALDKSGASRVRPDLVAILLTGIPSGIVPGFQNNTGLVLRGHAPAQHRHPARQQAEPAGRHRRRPGRVPQRPPGVFDDVVTDRAARHRRSGLLPAGGQELRPRTLPSARSPTA